MTVNTRTGSSRSPKDKPTEEFQRTGSALGVLGSSMRGALSNKRGPRKEKKSGRFRFEDSLDNFDEDNLYDFEDMPPKRVNKAKEKTQSKAVEKKKTTTKTPNKKAPAAKKASKARVEKHPPVPEDEPRDVNALGLTSRQVDIIAFVLVGIAVILAGSVWTPFGGPAGRAVAGAVAAVFGVGSYLVPIGVAALGIGLGLDRMPSTQGYLRYGIGGGLIALSMLGLIDTFAGHPASMPGRQGSGGMIGMLMAQPMAHGFSNFVAVPILVLILFYGALRASGVTVRDLAGFVGGEVARRKEQLDERRANREVAAESSEDTQVRNSRAAQDKLSSAPTEQIRPRRTVQPMRSNTSREHTSFTRRPAPSGYDDVAPAPGLFDPPTENLGTVRADRAADQGRSLFDMEQDPASKPTVRIPSLFQSHHEEAGAEVETLQDADNASADTTVMKPVGAQGFLTKPQQAEAEAEANAIDPLMDEEDYEESYGGESYGEESYGSESYGDEDYADPSAPVFDSEIVDPAGGFEAADDDEDYELAAYDEAMDAGPVPRGNEKPQAGAFGAAGLAAGAAAGFAAARKSAGPAGGNNPFGFTVADRGAAYEDEEDMASDGAVAGVNRFSTPEPPAAFDSSYQLPDTSVLKHGAPPRRHSEANEQIVDAINAVLEEFRIDAAVTGYNRGPTVTCYIIEVGPGVKMSKITGLQTNFAYAVKTSNIRLLMPIPGKSAVGIEVPNDDRETVYLGDALAEPIFHDNHDPLLVPIGKGVEGEFVTFALNKLPHMLVAGSTGSGKSAFVNSLLVSLLSRATPEQLRLILVDPKMVEFTPYEGIPHLLTPIITEPKRASDALMWLVEEMERRYLDMKAAGVRNIEGYNKKFDRGEIVTPPGSKREYKRFPYIVAIVDELADLMMTAPREIEDAIVRITQKARAAGIHLILATQRPSVNVVTGLIKSNIPSRVAFATASNQDSRVILDQNGAEKLLGMGDGLFIPQGQAETVRIQGAYVEDAEIHAIVEQTKAQVTEPDYIQIEAKTETPEVEVEVQAESDDDVDLLCAAAELAAYSTTLSISNLQRKLRMGFSKAGRMMDQLEEYGVVGPAVGTKAREVIITEEDLPSIQWMMRGGKPEDAPGAQAANTAAPAEPAESGLGFQQGSGDIKRVDANPNGGVF